MLGPILGVVGVCVGLAPDAPPEELDRLQWEDLPPAEEPPDASAPEAPPSSGQPDDAAPLQEQPEPGEPSEPAETPAEPTDPDAAEVAAAREAAAEPAQSEVPPDEEALPEEKPPPEPAEPQEDPAADLSLQPPAPQARPRPRKEPVFPRTWLSFGLGFGRRTVGFGVGATYFVVPALGLGLELEDFVFWDDEATYNLFRLTPVVSVLVLPRFRVSPFFRGGFGGAFFSHQLGSYGRWLGGAGVVFMAAQRWMVTVGLDLTGLVPDSRYKENFGCLLTPSYCSLTIEPQIGVTLGF